MGAWMPYVLMIPMALQRQSVYSTETKVSAAADMPSVANSAHALARPWQHRPMSVCVAHRCPEKAAAGQLCPKHQKRLDSGSGLPTADEPTYGDPSGHGVYGQVDVDEYGVLCHECGHRYPKLGHHLRSHKLAVAEYRAAHGLSRQVSLNVPPGTIVKKLPPPRRPRWRALTEDEAAALRDAMHLRRNALSAKFPRADWGRRYEPTVPSEWRDGEGSVAE